MQYSILKWGLTKNQFRDLSFSHDATEGVRTKLKKTYGKTKQSHLEHFVIEPKWSPLRIRNIHHLLEIFAKLHGGNKICEFYPPCVVLLCLWFEAAGRPMCCVYTNTVVYLACYFAGQQQKVRCDK